METARWIDDRGDIPEWMLTSFGSASSTWMGFVIPTGEGGYVENSGIDLLPFISGIGNPKTRICTHAFLHVCGDFNGAKFRDIRKAYRLPPGLGKRDPNKPMMLYLRLPGGGRGDGLVVMACLPICPYPSAKPLRLPAAPKGRRDEEITADDITLDGIGLDELDGQTGLVLGEFLTPARYAAMLGDYERSHSKEPSKHAAHEVLHRAHTLLTETNGVVGDTSGVSGVDAAFQFFNEWKELNVDGVTRTVNEQTLRQCMMGYAEATEREWSACGLDQFLGVSAVENTLLTLAEAGKLPAFVADNFCTMFNRASTQEMVNEAVRRLSEQGLLFMSPTPSFKPRDIGRLIAPWIHPPPLSAHDFRRFEAETPLVTRPGTHPAYIDVLYKKDHAWRLVGLGGVKEPTCRDFEKEVAQMNSTWAKKGPKDHLLAFVSFASANDSTLKNDNTGLRPSLREIREAVLNKTFVTCPPQLEDYDGKGLAVIEGMMQLADGTRAGVATAQFIPWLIKYASHGVGDPADNLIKYGPPGCGKDHADAFAALVLPYQGTQSLSDSTDAATMKNDEDDNFQGICFVTEGDRKLCIEKAGYNNGPNNAVRNAKIFLGSSETTSRRTVKTKDGELFVKSYIAHLRTTHIMNCNYHPESHGVFYDPAILSRATGMAIAGAHEYPDFHAAVAATTSPFFELIDRRIDPDVLEGSSHAALQQWIRLVMAIARVGTHAKRCGATPVRTDVFKVMLVRTMDIIYEVYGLSFDVREGRRLCAMAETIPFLRATERRMLSLREPGKNYTLTDVVEGITESPLVVTVDDAFMALSLLSEPVRFALLGGVIGCGLFRTLALGNYKVPRAGEVVTFLRVPVRALPGLALVTAEEDEQEIRDIVRRARSTMRTLDRDIHPESVIIPVPVDLQLVRIKMSDLNAVVKRMKSAVAASGRAPAQKKRKLNNNNNNDDEDEGGNNDDNGNAADPYDSGGAAYVSQNLDGCFNIVNFLATSTDPVRDDMEALVSCTTKGLAAAMYARHRLSPATSKALRPPPEVAEAVAGVAPVLYASDSSSYGIDDDEDVRIQLAPHRETQEGGGDEDPEDDENHPACDQVQSRVVDFFYARRENTMPVNVTKARRCAPFGVKLGEMVHTRCARHNIYTDTLVAYLVLARDGDFKFGYKSARATATRLIEEGVIIFDPPGHEGYMIIAPAPEAAVPNGRVFCEDVLGRVVDDFGGVKEPRTFPTLVWGGDVSPYSTFVYTHRTNPERVRASEWCKERDDGSVHLFVNDPFKTDALTRERLEKFPDAIKPPESRYVKRHHRTGRAEITPPDDGSIVHPVDLLELLVK